MKTFLIALLTVFSLSVQAMSLEAYLRYVSSGHPELRLIAATTMQRSADADYAQGAYDSTFQVNSAARLAGYYDGIYSEQTFTRPFQAFGSEIYTQYRKADGDFPVYEKQYETLSGGELSFGVKMSLWQGRDIDKNRLNIRQSESVIKKRLHEAKLSESEFYYAAISAYLGWLESDYYAALSEQLLSASDKQREAVKKRVKSGDLAEIALVEFNTRLMERKIALVNAQRKVKLSQQALLYFIGYQVDAEAFLSAHATPQTFRWPLSQLADTSLNTSLDGHPALAAQRIEVSIAQQKMRYAEDKVKPKLDLKLALAQDLGHGPASLEEAEAKIGMFFSVPLERTQAKAERLKASIKRQEAKEKLRMLESKIGTSRAQLIMDYQFAQELLQMKSEQVTLANQLYEQELRRFELGSSDFFLLNSREMDAFKASLSKVEAQFAVYGSQLALLKLLGVLSHDKVSEIITEQR